MYACILPGLFYIKTVNVELTHRNTFKKALDLTRDLLPMTTRSLKYDFLPNHGMQLVVSLVLC